jgi:excisionase family DNA binding protein
MDEFLTRADSRTFLKCSMITVERLLRQRAFPVVKVGRKVLVRRAAVEHWLITREIPAQPPPQTPPPDRLARALQGPPGPGPDDEEEA